jgi:peroxiredoxin
MTQHRIGLIGFLFLFCLAGFLTLRLYGLTTNPAGSLPGFPMHQGFWPSPQPTSIDSVAQTIPGFRLQDTDGRDVALADFQAKKAIAVVFIGTECPLVNLYLPRLTALQRELGAQGVQILAINSNSQDSPPDVRRHAQERKLPFPVLLDPGQKVADLFGAKRTPEAFLLDASGIVRYHGRIDDQYGVGADRRAPTRHDLKEAILEVLAGKYVSVPKTPVSGCLFGREPRAPLTPEVTYARDIVPVLQKHCQECHRPGQVAPFSLLTYQQTIGWSKMIAEVVSDGRMPPWNADARHGDFANDRRLPEADRKLLLEWVKQGCPKGDDKDLPTAKEFPPEGALGNPDLALKMKETFTIPAQAPAKGIEYQHFVLPTNFEEDVWVQAVEARPGNRAVVHHMLVYIGDKPRMGQGESADRDILVAYVPGGKPAIFPAGLAKRIPKGAKLVLEMHYTANGTEQVDQSSIALVFAKSPPEHEVRSRFIANSKFVIPPKADGHEVTASTTFEKDALVLTLSPHMHLRGKSFQFRAIYPDKHTEILLSVPRYDFNWQHSYVLKKPLHVPAGTRIECVGVFDNSAANPNNPDPTQEVRWGDQSWEEMMLGIVGYIYVNEPSRKRDDVANR